MSLIAGMVGGTLAIALTQLLVAGAFVGIGLAARRRLDRSTLGVRDVFVACWVGFALTTAFLIAWHFVLPISGLTLSVVGVIGLGGLVWNRRALGGVLTTDPWAASWRYLALLAIVWLWVADLGRAPLLNTDGGLYHLQGLVWAKAYPVVPGLVNLFGPLAFNNSSLLYDAMLDSGPWTGRAHHVANGLLLQVLIGMGITALVRAWHTDGRVRVQALYEGMLLTPAVTLVLHDWITGFVTDLSMTTMVLLAGTQVHALLLDDHEQSPSKARYRLLTIGLFCATAVTFKLSGAVFAATMLALAAGWWLARGRRLGPVVAAAVIALVVGGQWMARGVVLSGYPLFPTTAFGLPVEWRAPAAHADAEFAFAAHSARASTENVPVVMGEAGIEAWFPEWWTISASDDPYAIVLPLLLAMGLLAAHLARRRPRPTTAPHWPWLMSLPLVVAMVAWFSMAPEPRYILGVLWSLVAVVWAGSRRRLADAGVGSVRRSVLAVAILGVSPVVVEPIVDPHTRYRDMDAVRRLVYTNVVVSDQWLQPNPKRAIVRQHVTETGLAVSIPRQWCWDAPPPCTPNPSPNVRMRVPGRLDKGFWVDGDWQMRHWPAPNRALFGDTWRAAVARRGSGSGP